MVSGKSGLDTEPSGLYSPPRVQERGSGGRARVAVLEYYDAQRRIRTAAKNRLHISMLPEIPNKMRLTGLDLATLRLALQKARVEAAIGEGEERRFRAVGTVDDANVGAEVRLIAMGDGADCLQIWDLWKA